MKIKAALVREAGAPYEITEVDLAEPLADELVVKIQAVGLCGTDEAGRAGHLPFAFPVVLGHEGAGVVEAVGSAVSDFAPGDSVCLTFASCGCCDPCKDGQPYACEQMNSLNFFGECEGHRKPLKCDNEPVSSFFSQSSFASHVVVKARNAVKIPSDVDPAMVAPFGCGVQTGSGIVLNCMKAGLGDKIAIFGCGTVGLSAVMAAKIAGCTEIIAIGGKDDTLALARELGATATINRKNVDDLCAALMEAAGGPLDFALDTSGNETAIMGLLHSLRYTGGIALAGGGYNLTFNNFDLNCRTIYGVSEGHSNPKVFIPQLLEAYKQGRFPIDKIITTYAFENINEAAQDSSNGGCIKAVLTM